MPKEPVAPDKMADAPTRPARRARTIVNMFVASARNRRAGLIAAMVVAGLAVAAAWGLGLVRFAAAIPDAVADERTPCDAIVVLTGGSERLATGVGLLAEGMARRVFVSGVHPDADTAAILRTAGLVEPDLSARIESGHGARDTAGNARETAAWIRRHGFHSLRLVTASYHMPRSLLEFRSALPEATIVPHPVFPSHVKQSRWWVWPGTAALIVGEYNKFLWAWTRIAFARLVGRRPHLEADAKQ